MNRGAGIFVIVSGLVFWGGVVSAGQSLHLDFEDVPSGSQYVHPLHPFLGGPGSFQSSSVTVKLSDYFFASCTTAPDATTCAPQCATTCPWREGTARVDPTGVVGAGGNEVRLASVNLEFVFASAEMIELRYFWGGGDVNIAINGRFRNAAAIHDLNNLVVGGYRITVHPDAIVLTPDSEPLLTEFSIGGQELFIDDVFFENAEPIPSPDRFEPDDAFDEAADLGTVGERIEHGLSIHESGDEDYFRVTTAGPGNFHVEILFRHESGDLALVVFNEATEEIFRSDSGSNDEAISFPVDGPETFYIQVYGSDGATNVYDLFIFGPPGENAEGYLFVRGDSNGDLTPNISDGAHILNHLFLATPPRLDCEDAADVNDDGVVNIADPIRLFGTLFAGDPPPPPPNMECGPDPTLDELGCGFHPACPPETPSTLPIDTLVRIAGDHARNVWAGQATPGEPFPFWGLEGRELGYVVPFVRGRDSFPGPDEISAVVQELEERYGVAPGEGPLNLPPEFYAELEEALGEIGNVEVSATRENFPILAVRNSLHPYTLFKEAARRRAVESLGRDDVHLARILMLGPHEEYFEFSADELTVFIHVYTLRVRTYEELAALPSYEIPPDRIEVKELAWEEVLRGNADGRGGSHTVKRIDDWQLVPVVQWTWWCVPTAMTMVTCFWDHYVPGVGTKTGYGRVVDYWLENSTGHNVPNFIDEMIDPATGTWSSQGLIGSLNTTNAYQFSKQDISGSPSNDWAWQDLTSEIDANRPVLWALGPPDPKESGHAMAAFGYRIAGPQKFVIVYNTWGSTAAAQFAEYSYDQWIQGAGGQVSSSGIIKLTPGGGTGGEHAYLVAPDGGEVLFGPSEIRWNVVGSTITRTNLYHSTDGGKSWTPLAMVPITSAGSQTYSWTPSTTTNKGRVRIACYTAASTLVAADGSQGNFFVQQKADLTVGGTPPYCGYNAQGQLIVKVTNKGQAMAPASTTRVDFRGTIVSVPTPAIPAGSTVEVYADIPSPCWQPDCSFAITVDSGKVVGEANEQNNTVNGVCFS